MKKTLTLMVLCAGLVAGCGEQTNPNYLYNKRPVTFTKKAKDMLDCEVKAAQSIPSRTQAYTTPSFTTPVSCYGYTCYGGQTIGGNTVMYDANNDLRDRVYNQCMEDKGYLRTSYPIPECKAKQIPEGHLRSNTIIRAPEPGACVVTSVAGKASVVILKEDLLQ